MQIVDFPVCCTAHIITGLGETPVAEGGFKEITRTEILNELKQWANLYDYHAMFVATTNDQQTTANKVLRELHFKHSVWMKKEQHPETKVRLWFINIKELKETLETLT